MPDYSLVPVDYQPDFDDHSLVPVDHDPFAADGPIQQARTQLASQPQPDAGFDQPPSAPQTPGSAPPLSPIVPNGGQAPSVPQPPGQDPHSQNQAGGRPSGSQGGNGLSPGGSDAAASEPLPFSGFANPTLAESLVNRQKMNDQMELAGADRTGNNGAISDGGETYGFVTTGPTRRYLTSDQTGEIIMATSPFYAYDGTRYAFIDASPARPLTVTIRGDGTFTISRP